MRYETIMQGKVLFQTISASVDERLVERLHSDGAGHDYLGIDAPSGYQLYQIDRVLGTTILGLVENQDLVPEWEKARKASGECMTPEQVLQYGGLPYQLFKRNDTAPEKVRRVRGSIDYPIMDVSDEGLTRL
ncbi:MAG TPA: hypothetical protein VJG49_04455 [Candidatus Nanoarchaeia archaeon]|nr:hypothetical protein [Candidatus Nanoarchaeia archaeon]